MSGGMNLRPYGDSWANTGAQAGAGSIEERALQRAAAKLESVRRGADATPAGPDLMQVVPGGIFALLGASPFLLIGTALLLDSKSKAGGVAVVFLALALLVLMIPVLLFLQTRPRTPKAALKNFYRSLGRGRYGRARRLTVQADLDDFPRFQPAMQNLGRPSGYPRTFADEAAFKEYWRELLRSHPLPYCLSYVRNVRETPVGGDVMIVDFELRLMMNTSLWLLLIPAGLLIVVIVDVATRKTVTVPMRKLLVRAGEEWRIFSAEWQGYEEFNPSWLRQV